VVSDGSPESTGRLIRALEAALAGGPAVLPVAPTDQPADVPTDQPADLPPGRSEPEPGRPAALVVRTSGSTGEPRRVLLAAAALRASATATHQRLGGPGRWLLALPAHHVAGAQVIVRALLAGHPPALLDTRTGFRPDGFADAAAELSGRLPGGRRYTSLVPTQLHRVLADPRATEALCGFDAVLVGGAATPATLLDAARAAGVSAVTTYGMSETAGGCVYDGRPLDGVRVRLGPQGRIDLAGPTLADGYLGDPAGTASAFVDGWFRTSDLGRWSNPGNGGARLVVLGRADDVVTTGGESVHPAAVERVLTARPGVRAACVVGLSDPEWGQIVAAVLVLDDPGAAAPDGAAPVGPVLDGLADAVRAELGGPSVPRRLRVLAELPLRGVGKPDRAAVAALLTAETR